MAKKDESVIMSVIRKIAESDISEKKVLQLTESLDKHYQQLIKETINATMVAQQTLSTLNNKEAYRSTERRLYSLPVLTQKVKRDSIYLKSIQSGELPQTSKSIVRFQSSGLRLTSDEIKSALILNLEAEIAKDQYEIHLLEEALELISDDEYYLTVQRKYFEEISDEDVAGEFHCDPSTIRRHRNRLVRKVAIMLYGSSAV